VQFAKSLGLSVTTALISSLLVWFTTRIYGGGHVLMGQMPIGIFMIMSTGLGLGYIAGGQMLGVLLH
jgi:hypothetical protein